MEGRFELVFSSRTATYGRGTRCCSGAEPGRYGGRGLGAAVDRAATDSTLRVAHGANLPRVGLAARGFCAPAGTGDSDRSGSESFSERTGGQKSREPEHAKAGAQRAGVPVPRRAGARGWRSEGLPDLTAWAPRA